MAAYTKEASAAADGSTSYISAYDAIISRRESLRSAQPCSLVSLGCAQSYIYQDGFLCYVQEGRLRILCTYQDCETEVIANSYGTWDDEKRAAESYPPTTLHTMNFPFGTALVDQDSDLEPVICAFGTRPFQIPQPDLASWALNVPSTGSWYRMTEDVLVSGSHRGIGHNGHHEWVLDVLTREAHTTGFHLRNSIQLERFFGVDVGQTVAFEIFDGYLYAISNTSSPEVEEIDWTSYYHCYRLSVDDVEAKNLLYRQFWRRQHREGPINDSWTCLSIQKDEENGKVTICESRREWKNASSTQERTFYLTPMVFDCVDDSMEGEWSSQEGDKRSSGEDDAYQGPSVTSDALHVSSPGERSDDAGHSSSSNQVPGTTSHSKSSRKTNAFYPPNDVLVSAIDENVNHPLYEPAKIRPPRSFHPEFPPSIPSSMQKTYILTNTKHRSYSLASSAFIDVVTEDSKRAFNTAQISLRIGSRSLASPLDAETGLIRKPSADEQGKPIQGSDERFRHNGIHLWPPPSAPDGLLDILQIKGSSRKVEATADERSIVLAIGSGPEKRLVLINFDSTIDFPGLPEMSLSRNGSFTRYGEEDGSNVVLQQQSAQDSSSCGTDRKGKKRENLESWDDTTDERSDKKVKIVSEREDADMDDATSDTSRHGCWTYEPAMWKSIGKGYRFVYR